MQVNKPYAHLIETGTDSNGDPTFTLHAITWFDAPDYSSNGGGTLPGTYGADGIFEMELNVLDSQQSGLSIVSPIHHTEDLGAFPFDQQHPYLRVVVKMGTVEVGRTILHRDHAL